MMRNLVERVMTPLWVIYLPSQSVNSSARNQFTRRDFYVCNFLGLMSNKFEIIRWKEDLGTNNFGNV